MNRFLVSLAVQGEADVNRLLYWVIPSLLAPGNLDLLNRGECEARLLVHTTQSDRWMVATPPFQRLRQTVSSIEIKTIDAEPEIVFRSRSQVEALRAADEWGAALVLLPSNMIWAERSFWILRAALEAEHRAVHVPLVRVFEPAMTEVLAPRIQKGRLEVSHRKLVELALERLHPAIGQGHFWRNEDKRPVEYGHNHDQIVPVAVDAFHPSQLYWRVGDGLLVHSFNLHPLLILPTVRDADVSSYILHPDQIAWAAVPDVKKHFVMRDSDSLIGFELVWPTIYGADAYCQRTVRDVKKWVDQPRTPLKRELARKAIRIHAGDSLSPPASYDWIAAEAAAADLISKIMGD